MSHMSTIEKKVRSASKRSKSKSHIDIHGTRSISIREQEHPFELKFKKLCANNNVDRCPDIVRIPHQSYSINNYLNTIVINVVKNENLLNFVAVHQWPIEIDAFTSLAACIDCFAITLLKLEFCGLSEEHIVRLQMALRKNSSIYELSLNGNPNKEQNFHILLCKTSILKISLKFCEINEIGTVNLSKSLKNATKTNLTHLNLCSNNIGDDGCKHIASILRVNRKIIMLNMADNKITDEGCRTIIDVFGKFALTHEEIVLKRRIKMKLLTVVEQELPSRQSSMEVKRKTSSRYSRRHSKISKRSSKDRMSAISQASVVAPKCSSFSVQTSFSPHPFIQDSYEENNNIYCKGNNSLIYLDLSYNHLSEITLRRIREMLFYQRSVFESQGLWVVQLHGNDYEPDCAVLKEISDKLVMRCEKTGERSTEKRKRPASSIKL